MSDSKGYVPSIGEALAAPAQGMTWTQLAAIVVFVSVVLFAWRQVTQFIMGEL